MSWLNQFASQVQNSLQNVLDAEGNAVPKFTGPNGAVTPREAASEVEALRNEKRQLEESLLQLDSQFQEEMGRVITIKDDLQSKVKKQEAEIEFLRKKLESVNGSGKSTLENNHVQPVAETEINLEDDSWNDWGDGEGQDLSQNVGKASNSKLDETSHEVLELRAALDEAQRTASSLEGFKADFEKIRHENETLKNRLEALEEENEMLEADLEGLRSTGNSPRKTANKDTTERQQHLEAFCREVLKELLGTDDVTEERLNEARNGLSEFSEKVKHFDSNTEAVNEKLCHIETKLQQTLTEKVAIQTELDRLLSCEKELNKSKQQAKKATTDRDALKDKLEKSIKKEVILQAKIDELSNKLQHAAEGGGERTKHLEAQISELEAKLQSSEATVNQLNQELSMVQEKQAKEDEQNINELIADIREKQSTIAELTQQRADMAVELDSLRTREALLTAEANNVQTMLMELQDSSRSDQDESAMLLKQTRIQESQIKELQAELHIAREETQEMKRLYDENMVQSNTLQESYTSLFEKCSSLEQQLSAAGTQPCLTNEQEMQLSKYAELQGHVTQLEKDTELLKSERDSLNRELTTSRSQVEELRKQMESLRTEAERETQLQLTQLTEATGSLNEQLGRYAAEVERLEAEKQHLLQETNAAKQELEASLIMKKSFDDGLRLLQNEKEQLIGVMGEKSRENAELKSKVDSLMNALTTERQNLQQMEAKLSQMQQVHQQQTAAFQQQQQQQVPAIDTSQFENKIAQLEAEQETLRRSVSHKTQETAELKQRIQKLLDNESKLKLEIQRLTSHLVEVEESYTKEALAAEQKTAMLQQRLSAIEESQRFTDSSAQAITAQASQKVEMLEAELAQVLGQRDEALDQVSTLEDQVQQSAVSLASLQLVLEQLQRERDNSVKTAKKLQMNEQKKMQERIDELEMLLASKDETLKQMSETVNATSRLQEHLEERNSVISKLNQTLAKKDEEFSKVLEKYQKIQSGGDNKVDKQLMKNMLIGYFSSAPDKRNDVLRCIGGFLEFSEEESRKAGLVVQPKGLFGLFGGSPNSSANEGNDSFTSQLIAFVEKESSGPNQGILRLPTTPQQDRLRKVSSSSCPSEQVRTSSPIYNNFRPTDNPLFSHLPSSQTVSTATPSTSSRASTTSEPEALRQILSGGSSTPVNQN